MLPRALAQGRYGHPRPSDGGFCSCGDVVLKQGVSLAQLLKSSVGRRLRALRFFPTRTAYAKSITGETHTWVSQGSPCTRQRGRKGFRRLYVGGAVYSFVCTVFFLAANLAVFCRAGGRFLTLAPDVFLKGSWLQHSRRRRLFL